MHASSRESMGTKKAPDGTVRGLETSQNRNASELLVALLDHHERIVIVFRDLRPEIVLRAECLDRVPDLLELGIVGLHLRVDLIGRTEAGLEDLLAEGTQLCAVGDKIAHRSRVQ